VKEHAPNFLFFVGVALVMRMLDVFFVGDVVGF
jgi:hypothetical protein